MKKKLIALLAALVLALTLPVSLAESRLTAILHEGEEETITETLFECPQGFRFWYADTYLEAYNGERNNFEGAVVSALYSDDGMILSMMPEEDAEEYVEGIAEMSRDKRVAMDVYRETEDGQVLFLYLIAENGQYCRAVGEYALEAAEGNGMFLQRVLDSVSFGSACALSAAWGEEDPEDWESAQILITAQRPVTDVALLRLDWGDGLYDDVEPGPSWAAYAPLGSFEAGQTVAITLTFAGDMPENGIMYTDENGTSYAFALDISGEDGSLYFWSLWGSDE